jgi:hypothetical protein
MRRLGVTCLARANKDSLGFPILPGLRATVPEPDFIVPVLDYDWGRSSMPSTARGFLRSRRRGWRRHARWPRAFSCPKTLRIWSGRSRRRAEPSSPSAPLTFSVT